MKDTQRIQQVIDRIGLPTGRRVLLRRIEPTNVAYGPIYIQVEGDVVDVDGPDAEIQTTVRGRKWLLSRHMTDGEIVQTVYLAVKQFNEHELMESFLFEGERVFDPHTRLSDLVSQRKAGGVRNEYRS
jgi:hypothetical protein